MKSDPVSKSSTLNCMLTSLYNCIAKQRGNAEIV